MQKKILVILIIYSAITLSSVNSLPNFYDNIPDEELARLIIENMTDMEILGQVFFVGYVGRSPSSDILEWITERGLGGLKIFTRNLSTLSSLCTDIRKMQSLALENRFSIPMFVATDQEGGWVRHILLECSETPGNMALGASDSIEDALLTGYYMGMELKSLGINMNFGPAVDVTYTDTTAGIGPRSFSSDPVSTSMLAAAYFRGMEGAGVISVAKHYPGHGGASDDSHGYLPEVPVTFDELWDKDLLPYRILIKEGLNAVMGGHIAFPEITEETIPATVSCYFLKDVLRDMLGFDGIVLTDDLEMYGANQGKSDLYPICRDAILAGNNMVLISHTPAVQIRAWNKLLALMSENDVFYESVIESAYRIVLVKLRKLKNDPFILPDVDLVSENIPYAEAPDFFFNSSCRAVTLVKDNNIPYKATDESILLVGQIDEFIEQGLLKYPDADTYLFDLHPIQYSSYLDRFTVRRMARNYDTVIFCLANNNSLEVLQELNEYEGNLYVISSLTPVYLRNVPWVESAIAVYGFDTDSFTAGFAVLNGEFKPEGELPIEVY
jgi:beta-N-acetylhexosaminidase